MSFFLSNNWEKSPCKVSFHQQIICFVFMYFWSCIEICCCSTHDYVNQVLFSALVFSFAYFWSYVSILTQLRHLTNGEQMANIIMKYSTTDLLSVIMIALKMVITIPGHDIVSTSPAAVILVFVLKIFCFSFIHLYRSFFFLSHDKESLKKVFWKQELAEWGTCCTVSKSSIYDHL